MFKGRTIFFRDRSEEGFLTVEMKPFNDEDDVRALVRSLGGRHVRWVEPSQGSTTGLPDCWIDHKGMCVHFELKAGELKDGILKYKVRPQQRKVIREMRLDGVPVGLMIGIVGMSTVVIAHPYEAALYGAVEVGAQSKTLIWVPLGSNNLDEPVNFIISEAGPMLHCA